MTVAGKINALITAMAVLAGIILTLVVGQRDYNFQRDALILKASSFVGGQPQLQFTFYYQVPSDLQNTLSEILELSPAVKAVTMFDNQGKAIGQLNRYWATGRNPPSFSQQRAGLSPADQGVNTYDGQGVPEELMLLSKLTFGEHVTALTIPVISAVNPTLQDLDRADFAAAMAFPDRMNSRFVIGYINVSLSSTLLWSKTLPTVALSSGIALLIVFVFWLLARITTRRITAPLVELARVADDIAAGKQTQTIRIEGSGEIRDIASVFNGIITGLHQSKQQMNTDRKILSLKVDERTEQLSQNKQQLDRAVQKVSETQSQMRHLAYFDALTALPNRRLFTEQLTLLLRLAKRNSQNVGLLLIDIDNFKRINDSLGAGFGDRLLKAISERLAEGVRDSDVLHRREHDGSVMDLSRMGGDEFTVVLNQVSSLEAAQATAARLSFEMSKPYMIDRQEVVITASIGLAMSPAHADDVEGLLGAADTAMNTAKKRGRNRVLVYATDMEGADLERLKLENDLRRAEERGQLLLHYQPQVHALTGEVTGVETLVRWSHPERGLIPPFKWIPMAEELGLIENIGKWVIYEACAALKQLQAEGFSLSKMSVNVSALQFHGQFAQLVAEALATTGLQPGCLELELTEGIMINDEETTVQLVQDLKDLGVRLSIDDFGTGYSSLSYLTRFPLDELKIDRSFVIGLAKGQQNVELVRAIIAMAKSLHLDIVVEGVERVEELIFFREQEVHVIQGFLFSPPVPIDTLRGQLTPLHFREQLRTLDRQLNNDLFKLEKA